MEQLKEYAVNYNYYKNLWENPKPAAILSCPDMWDERADEWVRMLETDAAYHARMMERVEVTTGFLRRNSLLEADSHVLDIGCGPGLFTTAFAKTAGHVTGVDISPRMVHHAQSYAEKQGAGNVSFKALDFKQAAVGELGWRKHFDLVMSCITPAITGVAELHKIMEISRGHCLHVSFVQAGDSLKERIAAELYGKAPKEMYHWDGRVFCSVFNLLFLEGYNPQTFYHTQCAQEDLVLNETLVKRYADYFEKDAIRQEREAERIYEYMQRLYNEDGCLHRQIEECYGFLLWDVNSKRAGRMGY